LRIIWLRTRLWRAELHSRRRFSTATVCPCCVRVRYSVQFSVF
jgi:hypothetical protein